MKIKNKTAFLAGFMPVICMGALLAMRYFALDKGGIAFIALWQILPFLIPCIILSVYGAVKKIPLFPRFSAPPKRSMGFILSVSVSASLLSLIINCLFAALTGSSYYKTVTYSSDVGGSTALALLLMVVLPAFFEELFFRGSLMPAMYSGGTAAAVFVSALSFALCHGDARNLAGPFAAGLIFGYVSYALDSVWPAVIAHLINNAVSLLIAYVTRAYELLGLWTFFLFIIGALFCIFTALSMTALEKLLEKGKVKRFLRPAEKGMASEVILTPGLIILTAVFLIHVFTEG